MSECVTFEGRIAPRVRGKPADTLLRLPPEVLVAPGPAKRGLGQITEPPANLAHTRAPVSEGLCCRVGQSPLDQRGIAPGEVLKAGPHPAPDDRVGTAADIKAALCAQGLIAVWEALPPGKRCGLTSAIDRSRTATARAMRTHALISAWPA